MEKVGRKLSAGSFSLLLKVLVAVLLFYSAFSGLVFASDLNLEQTMRELYNEAGEVPEEIVNPVQRQTSEPDLYEKLRRIWLEKVMGFRVTWASARGKACFANQRVIAGAVEMYNLDNGPTYTSLNHLDVADSSGVMVSKMYLKSPIFIPEPSCEYRSYGDMTRNGIVYCAHHGTIPDYQKALLKASGRVSSYSVAQEREQTAIMGFVLFVLATIVVILMLWWRSRKSEAEAQS